jgi:hypothetical protein
MPEIPTGGLPFADRLLLRVANWATGRLSPMGALRCHWHLTKRRAR